MEIKCQLAALKWLLSGGVSAKKKKKKKRKARGREWSQEELWAQGLEEPVQAAPEQMGASGSERKWLSGWAVESGRRNIDGGWC